MRKTVIIVIIFLSCITARNCFSDTISIQDAMNKKLVTCTVKSIGGFTGQCVLFNIANITAEDILIHVEAGRFMMPSDTTKQRMIITKDYFFLVNKNSSDTLKSYAMCTQMHNAAPSKNMIFKMGNMAEGNLLKIVQIISKNNFQTLAAQSAVWTVTDNNDITDVYCDDKNQTITLRNFVTEFKNIKDYNSNLTDYTGFIKISNGIGDSTFLNYKPDKVEGAIQFELTEDRQLSLVLYNEKGETAKTCFRNISYKAGTNTITYDFSYYIVPKGNYHLKLFDNDGNILIDKFMTFKTSVFSF